METTMPDEPDKHDSLAAEALFSDDEHEFRATSAFGRQELRRLILDQLSTARIQRMADHDLPSAERTNPEHDSQPALRAAAVAHAITKNRGLAGATARELLTLAEELLPTIPPRRLAIFAHDIDDSPTDAVLDEERTTLAELTSELKELASKQLDDTDSFNIVLFGRTGAGKSSLIEALSHGSGWSISPGESDWTTTVNAVEWAHCRLVDTPGIEGWGRTLSMRELEDQARQELVTADIVVLCFDTQNQKAGEFRKVATWIADYRKPTIAVLNVRQPKWRYPKRVPRRSVRLRISQTVADHAAHVRESLAAVGLTEVPIVALNAQRAVFARASEPFSVPVEQRAVMLAQRTDVGVDGLAEWSNLPLLEHLLMTAVEHGAAQLRRGAVINQVVQTLHRMHVKQLPPIEVEAETAAEQAEAGIERMLGLLGAPESYLDELAQNDPDRAQFERFHNRLHQLEIARGGGFVAPATGSVHRHGQNVIDGLLAPPRSIARERAEALVDRAMATRQIVDRDQFQRTVFDTDAIEKAAADAMAELTHYLQRQIDVAARDVIADLQTARPSTATVVGTAGRGYRRTAIGVALVAAAVVGVWSASPLVLGAAVALAVAPVRHWLRKLAVKQYEQELSRARGAARKAVTDTFVALRDELASWFMERARKELLTQLEGRVDQALLLRRIANTAAENGSRVERAAQRLNAWVANSEDPTSILRTAAQACERAVGVAGPGGRALWLGEAWCNDPTGLDERSEAVDSTGRVCSNRVLPALVGGRLRVALADMARAPYPGSGQLWLAQVGQLLAGDTTTAPVLVMLERLLSDQSPRVLIYGDYNVGKSSFVRRLLADEGEPIPETLRVRGRLETSLANEYRWGRFRLIDTPGLQPGSALDDAAPRALPDAALIIYILGANLLTSDRACLDLVLHGDPERGIPPRLDRTLFVINRADELSVTPLDDPESFARAIGRRERELRDALVATTEPGRTAVSITPERIVFVAADPFGLAGDAHDVTSADFDEYREWDGMDEVRAALGEFYRGLQANSVDVNILHAGVGALGALMSTTNEAIEQARAAVLQLDRLAEDLRERIQSGRLIADEQQAALAQLGLGFVDQVVDEALEIKDDVRRRVRLERAVRFWEDPDLGQQVEEWASATNHRVAEWVRETTIVLQRRIDSHAFRRALARSEDQQEGTRFPPSSVTAQRVAVPGFSIGQTAQVVDGLRSLRVVKVGPESAVNIPRASLAENTQLAPRTRGLHQLLTAGSAVAVRGQAAARSAQIGRELATTQRAASLDTGAVEIATMIRDLREDRRQQTEFLHAKEALRQQILRWVDGVRHDDPAFVTLDAEVTALDALAASAANERSTRQAQCEDAVARYTRYEHATQLGLALLGHTHANSQIEINTETTVADTPSNQINTQERGA